VKERIVDFVFGNWGRMSHNRRGAVGFTPKYLYIDTLSLSDNVYKRA
jgi:hypothetical protein